MQKRIIKIALTLCLLGGGVYYNLDLVKALLPTPHDELVIDNANLLAEQPTQDIHDYHTMFLDTFNIDYRVITVNEDIDINLYGNKAFKEHKIGSKSPSNRGLLFLINSKHDEVRLEVSANLESVFTDAFIRYVEERQMVPYFNVGKVATGILATGEIIRIRAGDAQKGEEFDITKLIGSFGGGARTKAGINAGKDESFIIDKSDIPAAATPEETLTRYFAAIKNRNARGDLDLFTPESRKYMTGKVVTAAQMDNSVRVYKNCEIEHITYNEIRTRAVLFHSLKNRTCDPFLFEIGEDGKWRLDLKALGLGLGHTYGNIWYMHYGQQENSGIWKYNFGFNHVYFHRPKGEQFDHQGIPYYRRFGLHINHVYEGALIQKIHGEDSFMAKIGIKEGDMILEWEGVRFPHNSFISQRMTNVRPNLDIRMVIRRNDKIFSQIVKAPPYPSGKQLRFGATFQSPGPKIPFVHYVEPNSQAEKLGLKTGDYITKWQEINNPSVRYVYKSIKELKENEKITVEVYRNKGTLPLTSFAKPLRIMGKVH